MAASPSPSDIIRIFDSQLDGAVVTSQAQPRLAFLVKQRALYSIAAKLEEASDARVIRALGQAWHKIDCCPAATEASGEEA